MEFNGGFGIDVSGANTDCKKLNFTIIEIGGGQEIYINGDTISDYGTSVPDYRKGYSANYELRSTTFDYSIPGVVGRHIEITGDFDLIRFGQAGNHVILKDICLSACESETSLCEDLSGDSELLLGSYDYYNGLYKDSTFILEETNIGVKTGTFKSEHTLSSWQNGAELTFPTATNSFSFGYSAGSYATHAAWVSINGGALTQIKDLTNKTVDGTIVSDTTRVNYYPQYPSTNVREKAYNRVTINGEINNILILFEDSAFNITSLCINSVEDKHECGCNLTAGFVANIDGLEAGFKGNGTGIEHFWDFGDGYTSTLQNAAHDYAQEGEYVVCYTTTTDTCTTTTCDTITIKKGTNSTIPTINIITPNGDGVDDKIAINCLFADIYNRYGVKVKTAVFEWNGTDNNNNPIPMGEYIIKCKDSNTVTHVTVIR